MPEEEKKPWISLQALRDELAGLRHRRRVRASARRILSSLLVVAALAVLITTFLAPILRIYGTSMAPTLDEGEVVMANKGGTLDMGDLVAFYFNNNVLVKRVIGQSGDWIDMDADGVVSVNGQQLDEPYLEERDPGQCDLELPYQVPEGRIFVLGDRRSTSADSRLSAIGCVAEEQIVGKLGFRLWPIARFGPVG